MLITFIGQGNCAEALKLEALLDERRSLFGQEVQSENRLKGHKVSEGTRIHINALNGPHMVSGK